MELSELLKKRDQLYKEREKARKTMKEKDSELEELDREIAPHLSDGEMITSPGGYVYRKEVKVVYSGRETSQFNEEGDTNGING